MRRLTYYAGICLVLLSIAGLFSGCGSSGAKGNVLFVGNGAEPQDLDPHVVTGVPEHRIIGTLLEGLVDMDPETLEPKPAGAESWDISGDGIVYVFYLRHNAKWSNGEPVTAGDFLYAWERILTPAMGAEYASMLYPMKNAKEFNKGTVKYFAEVGAKALDDYTIEITLAYPAPYFLQMQIHYAWFPVHKATIEQFGSMTERNTKWTRPGNYVGNGAFMLSEWAPKDHITVVKNPHYWNAANVKLDGVKFRPIDNDQTEEQMFRTGLLDMTENIPTEKFDVYQKEHPELLHNDLFLGTYYYRLNVTKPPFNDARVRLAFALAIDRDDLVRNVVRKGRAAAYSYVPPNVAGYNSAHPQAFNPEKARQLLAEAGYPDGANFPQVDILYNTSEAHKPIAEAIQAMWKKHLNVNVTLSNQEWKVYLDSMQKLDYNIARSGWIGDYVDAMNFLECFTTGNGNNRTGFTSPEYDALIQKAVYTLDPQARIAVMQEAEQMLLEQPPLIPLYFYTNSRLIAADVKGFKPSLLGYINFKSLWLERGGAAAPSEG